MKNLKLINGIFDLYVEYKARRDVSKTMGSILENEVKVNSTRIENHLQAIHLDQLKPGLMKHHIEGIKTAIHDEVRLFKDTNELSKRKLNLR